MKGRSFGPEHGQKILATKQRKTDVELARTFGILPPGERIMELITKRKMDPRKIARNMGMHMKDLSRIVDGITVIDLEIAIKLEKATNVSSQSWLDLEDDFQLEIMQLKEDLETGKRQIPVAQEEIESHIDIEQNPPMDLEENFSGPDVRQELRELFKEEILAEREKAKKELEPVLRAKIEAELRHKIEKEMKKKLRKKLMKRLMDSYFDKLLS
jgi:addiction module HigA family antidote